MQEALNEWLILDKQNMEFHMGQHDRPYRSTVRFSEYVEEKIQGTAGNRILDLGCGAGAALGYILTHAPELYGGGVWDRYQSGACWAGKQDIERTKDTKLRIKSRRFFPDR